MFASLMFLLFGNSIFVLNPSLDSILRPKMSPPAYRKRVVLLDLLVGLFFICGGLRLQTDYFHILGTIDGHQCIVNRIY